MNQGADDFRAAIRAAGLEPPEHIELGRFHRFPGAEKRNGNKAGWCLLFPDGEGGVFGDWSTNISESWQAKRQNALTETEREAFRRQVAKARQKAERERSAARAETAQRAGELWNAADPAPDDHPYLVARGVRPHGARIYRGEMVIAGMACDGALMVPMRDVSSELTTLEFIDATGTKRFLPGPRQKGGYHAIGRPDGVICIVEGYATAASIHEATGYAVAMAFTAGNLEPVAKAIKEKFPDTKIIIAGDDDKAGVGQAKAEAAAQAVGGLVAIPARAGDDWNDVHRQHGPEAVRTGIETATSPTDIEPESGEPAPASDDAEVARLAALPPLEYERQRETAAEKLNIRVSALDAEVGRRRRAGLSDGDANGTSVALTDPEPWPDPVDGRQLLDDLAQAAGRYLVLPAGAASTIALWVMHAHAHDFAAISPVLGITSPTPECGKSTLLSLLGALVPRPLPASNITAAALFRAVEKWQPTLLIDEADTYLRDSDELRGVLNSGHMRASAWVIRTVGDDHEPRRFATWAPKAVALIGKLPPTLESRAVHVELRRMAPNDDVDQLRPDRLKHLEPLCRQARRWAADQADALREADPHVAKLRGRLADNWRHLFAIADLAGGDWPDRARRSAEALSAGRSEQTAGIMLLEDIRRIMADRDRIASADLVEALGKLEDRPWPEWGRSQRPITTRQVARLLEPFGIRPKTLRVDEWRGKGYDREALKDAFSRYLPESIGDTVTLSNDAASGLIPSVTEDARVTDRKPPGPASDKACHGVTDQSAGGGKDADGDQVESSFDASTYFEALQQQDAEDGGGHRESF